jgi:hypothetical protein
MPPKNFQFPIFNCRRASAVVAALLLLPTLCVAQNTDGGLGQREATRSNIAAYYYYAEPGDLTMQVNVWGTVRYPGRYEVKNGTDLGQLLSYAGGPQLQRRRKQDEQIITVRVSRTNDQRRQIIYETEIDSMITSSAEYPVMQEGDVITVEAVEDPGFTWQDIVGVVGSAASIGLLIVRAMEISR